MQKTTAWFLFYFTVLTAYAAFSFSLTDPNLVLTSWPPYWNFQQWMWQTFFHNRQLLTATFTTLITLSIIGWIGLAKSLPEKLTLKQLILKCLILTLPLFFSYNALSHDVFNYIFNAKMVVVYHQDPHHRVALDFPNDQWVRFMHNTHTPAPYGYGWTIFSLLPFLAGMGKFLLTWLIFRGLNLLAIPLLAILLIKLAKVIKKPLAIKDLAIVFLHPLFLIEIVSNSHNDLWMLIPAVASLIIVFSLTKKDAIQRIIVSGVLLAASISTKLATLTLVSLWVAGAWLSINENLKLLPIQLKRFLTFWARIAQENLGTFASILLFIPLLTPRSQLFHPWYFTWILIWLPFIKIKALRVAILAFSLSSLFRYIPWLQEGGFSDQIVFSQQLITWLGALVLFTLGMIWSSKKSNS